MASWVEIHKGGWLCPTNNVYKATGGPPPDLECPDPPPEITDDTIVMRVYVNGELNELTKADIDAQFGGPQSSYDPHFLLPLLQNLYPDRVWELPGDAGDRPRPDDDSSTVGGGGRRTAAPPTFVAPDERLVADAVKSTLVALTGRFDQGRVDMLADLYMQESKRSFDSKDAQVDPMETVKAKIRSFSDYQTVHQLRPEEVDELEWISSRQGALMQMGIEAERAVDLGVGAAQAGLTGEDTAEFGQAQEFARTGQARFGLEDKLRNSARAGIGLLR